MIILLFFLRNYHVAGYYYFHFFLTFGDTLFQLCSILLSFFLLLSVFYNASSFHSLRSSWSIFSYFLRIIFCSLVPVVQLSSLPLSLSVSLSLLLSIPFGGFLATAAAVPYTKLNTLPIPVPPPGYLRNLFPLLSLFRISSFTANYFRSKN